MDARRLLSALATLLGAAVLLAASGILTLAITMAALDGSWTQVIDFNSVGEGPLELVLAWALLPAVGWVLRGALENEVDKLAASKTHASPPEPQDAAVQPTSTPATPAPAPASTPASPPASVASSPAAALDRAPEGRPVASASDPAVLARWLAAPDTPALLEDEGQAPLEPENAPVGPTATARAFLDAQRRRRTPLASTRAEDPDVETHAARGDPSDAPDQA